MIFSTIAVIVYSLVKYIYIYIYRTDIITPWTSINVVQNIIASFSEIKVNIFSILRTANVEASSIINSSICSSWRSSWNSRYFYIRVHIVYTSKGSGSVNHAAWSTPSRISGRRIRIMLEEITQKLKAYYNLKLHSNYAISAVIVYISTKK